MGQVLFLISSSGDCHCKYLLCSAFVPLSILTSPELSPVTGDGGGQAPFKKMCSAHIYSLVCTFECCNLSTRTHKHTGRTFIHQQNSLCWCMKIQRETSVVKKTIGRNIYLAQAEIQKCFHAVFGLTYRRQDVMM